MNQESKLRLTPDQIPVLCTFFEENPEVICGYKKTQKVKDQVQMKWRRITPQLNSLGTAKDHRAWSKYLSNIKTKLKKKKIKWKEVDGSSVLMCNVEDFSEVELRMLQILKNNISEGQDQFQESNSSDIGADDVKKNDQLNNSEENIKNAVAAEIETKTEYLHSEEVYIRLPNDTPPPESLPAPKQVEDDEFETFGKNIAQQLRQLPLAIALETEEKLISVLRKQRIKVLNRQIK